MTIAQWSTTAANNASGVTGISWAEGQAPSTVNDSAREVMAQISTWLGQASGAIPEFLTGTAGTNTITATGPSQMAGYVTGQRFFFIPANTNTGATTLNITPSGASALGAKNIFFRGVACTGGEIVQNVPTVVVYDGTQFNLVASAASGAASGSSLVLVTAAQTASSSASITFSGIDSTYDEYLLILSAVTPATDGANLHMQVGDGGGLKATTYQYHFAYLSSGAGTYASNVSTGDTKFLLATDVDSTHGCSGEVRLFGFAGTSAWKNVNLRLGGVRNTSSQTFSTFGDGQWAGGTGALTQVQFTMSAGNIASGTFYLFGIRKS